MTSQAPPLKKKVTLEPATLATHVIPCPSAVRSARLSGQESGLVVASSDLHSLSETARYQKPSRTFRKKKRKKETITNENPSKLALASVVVVIWRLETRTPGC
jgi:hypothetical protein